MVANPFMDEKLGSDYNVPEVSRAALISSGE